MTRFLNKNKKILIYHYLRAAKGPSQVWKITITHNSQWCIILKLCTRFTLVLHPLNGPLVPFSSSRDVTVPCSKWTLTNNQIKVLEMACEITHFNNSECQHTWATITQWVTINREDIYLGRDAAFCLILWIKRPLWKLLSETSEWNFSRG